MELKKSATLHSNAPTFTYNHIDMQTIRMEDHLRRNLDPAFVVATLVVVDNQLQVELVVDKPAELAVA